MADRAFVNPSQVKKLVAQRLAPGAPTKQDMLQSFITHGLHGEDLKQEVGLQLSVFPAPINRPFKSLTNVSFS